MFKKHANNVFTLSFIHNVMRAACCRIIPSVLCHSLSLFISLFFHVLVNVLWDVLSCVLLLCLCVYAILFQLVVWVVSLNLFRYVFWKAVCAVLFSLFFIALVCRKYVSYMLLNAWTEYVMLLLYMLCVCMWNNIIALSFNERVRFLLLLLLFLIFVRFFGLECYFLASSTLNHSYLNLGWKYLRCE